jgi:rubrerythrin
MSYDFSADEIFEMAEQIERNGARFYRKMAENISDKSIRELLLDFAAMEDDHERVFASMRADLSDKEREPRVFDPQDEATLYLRALADLRVFNEKAENGFVLPEDLSESEKGIKVFREAINQEKDSIVFYLGMKGLVPENLGREKIDSIIKEEMKHIRLLSNKLASLKA